MSVLDWLRKSFGYVLLIMGVSRPAQKSKPPAAQPSESGLDSPASRPKSPAPRP